MSSACSCRWSSVAAVCCVTTVLTVAALWSLPAPSQTSSTDQQKERLKERDRYAAESRRLAREEKLPEAIQATEKKLAVERQVFGDVHDEVADSLGFLAGLHERQEDFAASRKLRQESLAIRTKLHGAEHWRTREGQWAMTTLDRLTQLGEEQRRQLHTASRLNRQVGQLARAGKYDEALPLAQKVVKLRGELLGEKHPDYAASLKNLGWMYREKRDFAHAEPLYRQALRIGKETLGEEHPSYALTLNNLGWLYEYQWKFPDAERCFREAIAIYKKVLGETHPYYAISLNNLAGLYGEQGDYVQAEALYQKALEIRRNIQGETHVEYALGLNNLAWLYGKQGAYVKAEPLLEKALEIRKKVLGETHPYYASTLNNLSVVYAAQGKYAKAEPLLQQSLEIRKKILGETHPAYGASLNNLAGLCVAQGNYAKAEPLFQKALEVHRKALSETHPAYVETLHSLACVSWGQGCQSKAEALFRQSIQLSQGNLEAAARALSERQQLAMIRDRRSRLDNYLSFLVQAKLSPQQAYADVLAWKGVVFLQQRQQRDLRRQLANEKDPQLGVIFDQLQSTSHHLATLAFATPAPARQSAWKQQLAALTEEKEQLEVQLAQRSAAFRQHQAKVRPSVQKLQDVLPSGVALIDFLEYRHSKPSDAKKGKKELERRMLAFVLRAGQPLQMVELGAVDKLQDAIQRWRTTIRRSMPTENEANPGAQLRRLVWEALAPHLKDIHTVLVAPDGVLNGLPLAGLPGAKPGTYLIEEVAVAVLPVPQMLPELLTPSVGEAPASPPSLLLVGDVDFGADPGSSPEGLVTASASRSALTGEGKVFLPLESTRAEVLAIRDSFERSYKKGKVKLLREEEATEAAVRQEAPEHRWLHFATHGFFAPPQVRAALGPPAMGDLAGMGLLDRAGVVGFHPGLLSGIVLAGANRQTQPGEDNGILTALEVAALDLSRVDMVVLSACETGLGQVAGGEGALGLQRAFQVAGAKTTVSSLWAVDDKATRLLMERFYQNLWRKKLGKLEALRQAQREMLAEGFKRGMVREVPEGEEKASRVPPYYWAAFVLSGDWR